MITAKRASMPKHMSINLATLLCPVDGAGRSVRTCRPGWPVVVVQPDRFDGPAGWHGHAHLHLRQAPVSIDVAAPWRPVDGAGRSVRTCENAGE